MNEDYECTLCEGTGVLIDNITGDEYRCKRCLGTGKDIMKMITSGLINNLKKEKEETKQK